MYLDFPGANSSPDEEPEDQQRPGWSQVNFFHPPTKRDSGGSFL
jgi:hypothetical protein